MHSTKELSSPDDFCDEPENHVKQKNAKVNHKKLNKQDSKKANNAWRQNR